MGNRALIVVTDGQEFSPVIYTHGCGNGVESHLRTALLPIRDGYLGYYASCIVIAMEEAGAAPRIWNAPAGPYGAVKAILM